jgi:hypothetical protein
VEFVGCVGAICLLQLVSYKQEVKSQSIERGAVVVDNRGRKCHRRIGKKKEKEFEKRKIIPIE